MATAPSDRTAHLLARELLDGDEPLGDALERLAALTARALGATDGSVALAGTDGPPWVQDGSSAVAEIELRHGGRVLGSLRVVRPGPSEWDPADTALLERSALLCEHLIAQRLRTVAAVRSERERQAEAAAVAHLSERLQRALLTQPTETGRFDVAITYQPGSRRMLLGGDFAATRLFDGDALDFIIGDVAGHGPEAAALAVGLRASWRALRVSGLDHTRVVCGLEALVLDAGLTATVLLGTLTSDGALSLTAAGHPPPIVIGAGARELAVPPGPMLGLDLPDVAWRPHSHELGGDVLLAFTDGLVEGRAEGGSGRFGVAGLLSAAARGADPDELIEAATRANGGPLRDDVAILRIAL